LTVHIYDKALLGCSSRNLNHEFSSLEMVVY